jgi:Fe-S cluster assembly iron-binding protein IscA
LALDEPEANDKIVTINEIRVAVDPNIEPYTETLTLDYLNGGLALLGNESDCC